ncbi:MAG: Hsp20/alpha crystallin family protein [Chitinispirillaceae bacterium]|nr:Hsp20/alpha crystallin family protein [Chitinispirillaceae bacterium]
MLWDLDLFSEMDRLRREMNNLFSPYARSSNSATTFPLLNVYDDKDAITVTAELPGLSKDQVNITFSEGILTLSGTLEPLKKVKDMVAVRKERAEGAFEKTLRVPVKVNQDAIAASFANGILTITMPKAEEAKPKTISIEAK